MIYEFNNTLQKLAVNGCADDQITLGDCYYCAYGTKRDRTEAEVWHKKAADNESEEAKNKVL